MYHTFAYPLVKQAKNIKKQQKKLIVLKIIRPPTFCPEYWTLFQNQNSDKQT